MQISSKGEPAHASCYKRDRKIVRACARGIPILDMKLLPRCGVKMKGEGDFDVDQSLFVNQAEPLMLNFLTVSSVEGQATAS